jgi:hypothetical protein
MKAKLVLALMSFPVLFALGAVSASAHEITLYAVDCAKNARKMETKVSGPKSVQKRLSSPSFRNLKPSSCPRTTCPLKSFAIVWYAIVKIGPVGTIIVLRSRQ